MLDALHKDLRFRLERCDGASARVAHVVPIDATVDQAVEALDAALGERHARLGMLGMTSYRFPPQLYRSGGAKATELICEAASEASSAGGWSHILMGGSWGGPQRTFAEAFEPTSSTVVHVLPNTGEAIVDLIYLMFDDAMEESQPRKTTSQFVFVGGSYRARNCVLATLCAQVFIVGGGPGTHLEVMAARATGAGLLPLVRSGGLAEGMDFNGRNLRGLVEALSDVPPPDVPLDSWKVILGLPLPAEPPEDGNSSSSTSCCGLCRNRQKSEKNSQKGKDRFIGRQPTFSEYVQALRSGLAKLRPSQDEVPNRWNFSKDETRRWEELVKSIQKPTNWDLMH